MTADELSERDRAHYDDLVERSGGDAGSDGYRIPDSDDVTPSPVPDPEEDHQAIRFSMIELGPPSERIDQAPIAKSKDERIAQLERELDRTRESFKAYTGTLFASAPLLAWDETGGHSHIGCGTNVTVSMTTRAVRCRVCGAELEPMDVLRQYARGERQFVQHVDNLVKLRRDLETETRKLNDLKNSLRSAIRKKGVDPDAAMRAEQQGIDALKAQRKKLEAENEHLRERAIRLRAYIEKHGTPPRR